MRSFWGKVRAIEPWVQADHLPPTGPLSLPAGSAQFHNVDACIMCGACVAACTVHEVDQGFLGPAALAKAYRFVADPREDSTARTARLEALQAPTGMWDCTSCNFCVEVCPKDVKTMEVIIRLRSATIQAGLRASGGPWHVVGIQDLLAGCGRLNVPRLTRRTIRPSIRRHT